MMLWIEAVHVIAVICWFAGLFYLPRLFVYHAMSTDLISDERFKVMERKLFWGIMTPSALLSLFSGLWLLCGYGVWHKYHDVWWLKLKLGSVALLFIYHFYCWLYLQDFRYNRNQHSHVFYRWLNEAPVILLSVIIILIFVKPF